MMFVYFMSYAVNNANSYGEHWGTLDKRGDTTRDSVGIYSDWYNWFGFNAGLHQEHHHKPGVHWTKLPEVTKLLPDDRYTIKHGVHITNNPFWSHFKLLFKKNGK
jgi:fatty acid desaturase